MQSPMFYAHSSNDSGRWHPLAEHLSAVGLRAAEFAAGIAWIDESKLAGLLHDLGKYGDSFQARLRGEASGLDHWSMGAWLALKEYQSMAAALAIEGHHVGLQSGNKDALRRLIPENLVRNHSLRLSLSDADLNQLKARADADGLAFAKPYSCALSSWGKAVAGMLDVRLLFSCLVDADFLDTEAHFEGDEQGKRCRPEGPRLDPTTALAALDAHMQHGVRATSRADDRVRSARETLWQAVIDAAHTSTGLFTLTAPTGSGKTLAMLKFALEHAAKYNLKRIVVAMPFLTIIEQTARAYRAVFSDFPEHFVLEHHSLAGLGGESSRSDAEERNNPSERQRRLLSQNWDAPIVLTTNVQLLESLFSNRPSTCRKLHNLMDSVILFDEAQSLPQHLAVPTLAALSHLSSAYRSSVVFATATQPAFDALNDAVTKHAASGWQPTEAVPEHAALFAALKRVEVRWPQPDEKQSWNDIATELRDTKQVLCVVNLKRHALQLLEALAGIESIFHLSTNLCAAHRQARLAEVRSRLNRREPCRLISTQCVEAGVDVDFPTVYRAMAPLEAIAQAAGRCNREGRIREHGKVIVFAPNVDFNPAGRRPWTSLYPTFAYYQAAAVAQTMLAEAGAVGLDINDPKVFQTYYRRLYDVNNPASQNAELQQAIDALDFPRIADLYRLINQDAIQVLVPWAERREEFDALRTQADRQGIGGEWMRRAQYLAVGIYRPKQDHPAWGVLIPAKLRRGGTSDEWFILEDPRAEYYDNILGLRLPQEDQVFIA